MVLSPKAKLLANNPGLQPNYVLDPATDPNRLSDQFKILMSEDSMANFNTQRLLDKLMPIVGFFENGRFVAVAKCDEPGCERETRWTAESMPQPSVVFTKIRNRKWNVNRKRITCDVCVRHKRQAPVHQFKREPDPPMKLIGEALRHAAVKANLDPAGPLAGEERIVLPATPTIIHAEGEDLMSTADTLTPTDKARVAKRRSYEMLLEHYDVAGKRYNGDWSDRRISELTGLSETKVGALRDEDFGPAGPPPQLIDLKTRMTALEAKLREKEAMVLRAMDELPQMQEELKLVQSQLQALVSAHGWSA